MSDAPSSARRSARRTPLAWRNIVHNKVTMVISGAAVALAVVIMFMELGFLNGLYDSQTGALRLFRGDLVMLSRMQHMFVMHEMFERTRLQQVAGFEGVEATYPVYIEDGISYLRNRKSGLKNAIRVLGVDPADPVFVSREINQLMPRLHEPMTILFDEKSRRFFGKMRAGMKTELADRVVTVAGTFRLGSDYFHDGNVITSIDTFFTLFPNRKHTDVFVGVIQLADDAAADKVAATINRAMGPDVEVLRRADVLAREKGKWQKATPTGYVFTMGVAVGFIIGVFICYQILYTDITNHLPQLATMKALGYHNRALVRLVLTQAVLLGVLGFLPAILLTFGLYATLTAITGIVTKLTLARVALVFTLTLGMCLVAGLLAVRKALAVDPAELF